jgi:hypothetical protein
LGFLRNKKLPLMCGSFLSSKIGCPKSKQAAGISVIDKMNDKVQ